MKRIAAVVAAGSLVIGLGATLGRSQPPQIPDPRLPEIFGSGEGDVPYVSTPEPVVEAMLRLVEVGADDHVVDLGSGDGRIVIRAAREFGATGVGVDIDPELVEESRDNARAAGVEDRVEFREQDLFETDLTRASVVTLYLLPSLNLRLRHRLLRQLDPGSRVVSNTFGMGTWSHDRRTTVSVLAEAGARSYTVYAWIVPASVGGVWRWRATPGEGGDAVAPDSERQGVLRLRQRFQELDASTPSGTIRAARIRGRRLTLSRVAEGSDGGVWTMQGEVRGDRIRGTMRLRRRGREDRLGSGGNESPAPSPGGLEWEAQRIPVDVEGSWRVAVSRDGGDPEIGRLAVRREGERWTARLDLGGMELGPVRAFVWGGSLHFTVDDPLGAEFRWVVDAFVEGDRLTGSVRRPDLEVRAMDGRRDGG